MTKEQGNSYRMYLTTQAYMDTQSPIWNSIQKIVHYKNDLDELITRITEKTELVNQGQSISENKMQLKKVLALKVSCLSGVLQAYASEKGDGDLMQASKLTKSELILLNDADVNAAVVKLTEKAKELLSDLADYGISEAMLTEILTTLSEYNSLIGKPRNLLNEKYVRLATVNDLFEECSTLLKERMDKLMLMFRESNAEFYDGYQRARTIVDF